MSFIRRPPAGQILTRALWLRCPICGQGRLFRSAFRMHPRCSGCGVDWQREEGFFVGTLFLGYGVAALVAGLVFTVGGSTLGWQNPWVLALSVGSAAVLPVVSWRWARALWLALDQFLDPRLPPT